MSLGHSAGRECQRTARASCGAGLAEHGQWQPTARGREGELLAQCPSSFRQDRED